MAPATAELETVKEKISDAMARIQALRSQLEQTEITLEHLREKEAAILENTAHHRGVLSPFRDLPEDVLREICLALVEGDISSLKFPTFRFGRTLAPYLLMQICCGIRRIVLETPPIWASISFEIDSSRRTDEQEFTTFICRARKWLQRAGRLALSISVTNFSFDNEYDGSESEEDGKLNPANNLIDFLLTYSTRWKSVHFSSSGKSTLVSYVAALPTVNVPQLRSISIRFQGHDNSIFSNSAILAVPTLEHLELGTSSIRMSDFTVNWEILTSLTLNGYYHSPRDVSLVLRKTKCLTFCEICVDYDQDLTFGIYSPPEINLPLLKILDLTDELRSSTFSILNLINAPILQTFRLHREISVSSISTFLKRSPNIQDIFLYHFFTDKSLMLLAELLHLCPSLIALSLAQKKYYINQGPLEVNRFLQIFVQENDVVTCPTLQYFTFEGLITMSLLTLQQFLEGKQRSMATRKSICAWKRVTIDLDGIDDKHVRKQMLDLFSQKLEEGISVGVPRKETA